jgi:phage shock protein A
MLLAAKVRESYRDYLRRSGRRPRTWGIPLLEFGFTFGSPTRASAASDDGSPRGLNEAGRLLAEREELIARVSRQAAAITRFEEELFVARAAMVTLETRIRDLERENRHLMDEGETERAAAEVATVDASAPRIRSGDEPTLECGSSDSPDQAEPSAVPEECGWESLRMRASALEAKLSGLKVRAAELEDVLIKLRQDYRRPAARARRASADGH